MKMESANLPRTSTHVPKETSAVRDSPTQPRWKPALQGNTLKVALPIAYSALMATTSRIQFTRVKHALSANSAR